MGKKLPDTPGRVSRRKYEEANKEARRQTHKGFNAMLYRGECEEIERFCEDYHMSKADFLRYAYGLVLEENKEYERLMHFKQKKLDR